MKLTLDEELYEEAEIAWSEMGMDYEAMYDPWIDKEEWLQAWVEEHARFDTNP